MLPTKTILLSVLFFATSINAQTKDADFLKKPHVLPSAERAYHAIYHELDSKATTAGVSPMFGQLYVALIEDQFTFGGDLDDWDKNVFHKGDRKCKSFMAANVHHLCDDKYFLVHQDMVKLQKTILQDTVEADLSNACPEIGFKREQDPNNYLVYRYKHRVLMSFKESMNQHKCFGTYDSRTDTFTCMRVNEHDEKKIDPIEVPNFLWKETDGTFARGGGTTEVFCKQMHYPSS